MTSVTVDGADEFEPGARDRRYADMVIDLARKNVAEGGRPFACVIARGDEVVQASPNLVAQTNDPTAHAEIVAISEACKNLGTEHLSDCTIYVLAHPCPMCLAALYYCSPERVVFLTTRSDYAAYYVDDRKYFELNTFYSEFGRPWPERRLPMEYRANQDALDVYRLWQQSNTDGDQQTGCSSPVSTS